MKKNLLNVVAVVVAIVFVSFVGYKVYRANNPIIPEKLTTLKVAYQDHDIPVLSVIDLAESKGYMKQAGLKLERKTGLTSISTFLTSGQVDVTSSSISPVLTGFYSNQNFKLLAITDRYTASIRIVSRYPQGKLGSVKTVAVNRLGGTYQNLFVVIAKGLGMNPNSVKYTVAADPQTTVALLQKGAVDFAFVNNEEAFNKAKSISGLYVIDPAVAYANVSTPLGIITTSKILSTKSAAVNSYVAAYKKAYIYFANHRNESIEFLSAKYGFSKEVATQNYNELMAQRTGVDFSPNLDLLKDIAASTKILAKPVNPSRSLSELLVK